jgi:hypothetical protein
LRWDRKVVTVVCSNFDPKLKMAVIKGIQCLLPSMHVHLEWCIWLFVHDLYASEAYRGERRLEKSEVSASGNQREHVGVRLFTLRLFICQS